MRKRPPIGIPPRFIIDEFRLQCKTLLQLLAFDLARWIEIRKCVVRYTNAGLEIRREWAEEYMDIEFKMCHWRYRN